MVDVLTAEQVERVHSVTDSLGLNRNWIVVPLPAAEAGRERIMPDGKVLIAAPGGTAFDAWFSGLRDRLSELDLSRTPRAHQDDPPLVNTPVNSHPGSGSRRYMNLEGPRKQGWRGDKS
jgi:hypothetical protein